MSDDDDDDQMGKKVEKIFPIGNAEVMCIEERPLGINCTWYVWNNGKDWIEMLVSDKFWWIITSCCRARGLGSVGVDCKNFHCRSVLLK